MKEREQNKDNAAIAYNVTAQAEQVYQGDRNIEQEQKYYENFIDTLTRLIEKYGKKILEETDGNE